VATITEITEMPGHFAAYPAKQEAFEKSMAVWELRYGSVQNGQSHTAAWFGFVPIGIGVAWAWAEVLQRHPTRGMIRSGLNAWNTLMYGKPWTVYCRCEDLRSKKFAELLGFVHEGFHENEWLMRRDAGWRLVR
jgi:hypothetical protein